MNDFVNWLGIINGLILLLLGLLYKRFPPKKINYFYGYRTTRSMKNQGVWDYANTIGADMIIYTGVFTSIFGIVPLLVSWEYSVLIPIGVLLIALLIGFIYCERLLDKRFDKDGNPS